MISKAKNWYDQNKKDIVMFGKVFGIVLAGNLISYCFGYKEATEATEKRLSGIKQGLTLACVADPSLVDHMDEALKKAGNTLTKI